MRIKAKLFSLTEPASDGSMIPLRVVQEYLASPEYKEAIERHTMLGTLTHRARNIQSVVPTNSALSKTVGKDDSLLIPGNFTAPTHYIESIEINNADMWVYAVAKILPKDSLDDEGNQLIKRLRGLLNSGVKLGLSAVILGFWQSEGNKGDVLKKLVSLKSYDFTMNPSWRDAQVTEIYDDDEERLFSEAETSDEVRVKCFSDPSEAGAVGFPRSSKIDGQFTVLKAKEFSNINIAELSEGEQKEFSAATLRERLRYAIPSKFSPRMRMRRLFIDYKQLVKQMGGPEKMDPESLKTLRSLFMSDLNMLMGEITKDIKNGKQIATLLGASSLGVVPRKAAQELQIPYRQAFVELDKTGKITPIRFQKIKEAYTKFLDAIANEVFKSNNPLPDGLEEEAENEEKGVK